MRKLVWLTAVFILSALSLILNGCSTGSTPAATSPAGEITSPALLYFYTEN